MADPASHNNHSRPGAARQRGHSAAAMYSPALNASGLRTTATRAISHVSSRDSFRRSPSVRIRRPASASTQQTDSRPSSPTVEGPEDDEDEEATAGRRRSFSAPQRYSAPPSAPTTSDLARQGTQSHAEPHMQTITEGEGAAYASTPGSGNDGTETFPPLSETTSRASNLLRRRSSRRIRSRTAGNRDGEAYEDDIVDLLDLIDPEVRAIGTLNNVQNSLFVPDLGGLINRRPTYDLSPRPTRESIPPPRSRRSLRRSAKSPIPDDEISRPDDDEIEMQPPRRTISIDSQMSDSRYAVLPHGVSLENWTDEDIGELDDHVRHMLHSRREGFKRSMKGFRKYVSRPLGLFVTVYAILVTLFGAAWVFFLIGWIYVGPRDRRDYITDIIDNVLVALFALIGDGLAPFRAVDTYHMCFIAHYHRLTWRLRKERNLPKLVDPNDLPDRRASVGADRLDKDDMAEFSVLSPVQQRRLQYHQAKFSKTHTFYRPHETPTHHAFPLRLLIAIVVLLDCHSLLQIALGTCTWSINYTFRPEALTATILSVSITSNIAAGVLISIGDHQTRKKDVLERIFRQGLTEEAIRKVQRRHVHGDMAVAVGAEAITEEPEDGSAAPKEPARLVKADRRNVAV